MIRENIWVILVTLMTAISGSFAGWLFGRRRQNIDNIDAATDTWQKIVDSLEHNIDKLLAEKQQNADLIRHLTQQQVTLETQMLELQGKLKVLERRVACYEKKLKKYNIDFQEYEK